MRYEHQLTAVQVVKVAAPQWRTIANVAIAVGHDGQVCDLAQFIIEGSTPMSFKCDDLPAGFLLSPYGKLMTDGTQQEGVYELDVCAQNPPIAPLWVHAIPFTVQVVHAPEAPTLDADDAPKHTNLSLGISN